MQEHIKENVHIQLLNISQSRVACTSQVTGLVAHCPANNCSEVINLFHEGLLHLSGYYWLKTPSGEVAELYCIRDMMQALYDSCAHANDLNFPSGTYTI